MAYTHSWFTSQSGGVPADTIDTLFSNLRLDLEERLESALITDFGTDPVVAKPEISGKVTGKLKLISWEVFDRNIDKTEGAGIGNVEYVVHADFDDLNGDTDLRLTLGAYFTPGITITKIRVLANPNSHNVSHQLYSTVFGDPTSTTTHYSAVTSTASVLDILDTGTISVLLATDRMYKLRVILGGFGAKFYGVEITYDTPDSRYLG